MDTVTVEDCIFVQNRADPGRAGALFIHADREVKLLRSAFVKNSATRPGGAIWADGKATYTLQNCLFSDNSTDGDLGGALRLNLATAARLRLRSCTLVGNTATKGNGAIWLPGKRDARLRNSILAHNTGPSWAQQVNFPVTDEGGNIIWPDPKAPKPTIPGASVADPKLGSTSLVDGTWVRIPAAGSPAIDGAVTPAPALDQRGASRKGKPDVGSYEVGASCAP